MTLRVHLPRVAALALTFIFNVAVARSLGIVDSGHFFMAYLVSAAVAMVGRVGSDLAVLRMSGERRLPQERVRRLRRLCVGGSAVVCASVVIFCAISAALLDDPTRGALSILALSIPSQSLCVFYSAVLRTARRPGVGAFAEVGGAQGLWCMVVAYVWLTSGSGMSLHAAAWAFVGCSVAAAVITHLVQLALVRYSDEPDPASESPWDLLHMSLATVLYFVWVWLPAFAIWISLGPASAAVVVAAMRYSALIPLVPAIQLNALLPSVATEFRESRREAANEFLDSAFRQLVPAVIATSCVIVVFAPDLMIAYGKEFESGALTLRVSAIASTGMALAGFVVPIGSVLGYARQILVVSSVATVVGIPVAAIIAARFGQVPGVAASGVLMVAVLIGLGIATRRTLGLRLAAFVR